MNRPKRIYLERAIANFCREMGFRLDLTAPSHQRAVDRAIYAALSDTREAGPPKIPVLRIEGLDE